MDVREKLAGCFQLIL